MKSNSGHEPPTQSIRALLSRLLLIASAFVFLGLVGAPAAHAVTSLAETARMEAADRLDPPHIRSLFQTYVSLGMRREAAAFLERKIHLGELPREEAAPLFHEILMKRDLWDDPENLVAVCEAALGSGARTPRILYAYGTGLRLSGRRSEGSAILAQIGPESPIYPYALYAIGQIAAEEGDSKTALEVLARVRQMGRGNGEGESLARRSALSQAEYLLALGRHGEAAQFFEALLRKGNDPLGRAGLAAARIDDGGEAEILPAETIAGWPVRQRVLFFLLQGGRSRSRGQFDQAIVYLVRSEEELMTSLSSAAPPVSETLERDPVGEFLRLQIDRHRSLRQKFSSGSYGENVSAMRENIVELMLGLLLMDHSVSRSRGEAPAPPSLPENHFLSAAEIEEIIRKIEQATLDGVDVDRLVEEHAKKLDIFQNLAHPIQRYRLLGKLEKNQAEIHKIKERIRQHRQAAIAGLEASREAAVSRFLREMGRFLVELDAIRTAAGETREFIRQHFDILRQGAEEGKVTTEARQQMMKEALAFDNERLTAVMPFVQSLEKRNRIVSWERRKQELLALRPAIRRQLVDALVSKAHFLREKQRTDGQQDFFAVLERAARFLSGDQLSPRDRSECAINIGHLLSGETGRWEPHPGRAAGEKETAMIAALLPALATEAQTWDLREDALYMATVLRRMARDPGAGNAAREFLEKYPSSPHAGEFAVRLGHEAYLSGKTAAATTLYRTAAEGSNPEAAAVARYMLGWGRFQNGDAEGATRELSFPLSDPSLGCGDPSHFERAVLSLAVRAWNETPVELLPSYGPVRDGGCGARLMLASLGDAEEKRGETARAAVVYDVLARRFPNDEAAPAYEKKSIEDLRRAGREEEALSRALSQWERYGPGSSWAGSQAQPAREKARSELAGILKSLSEEKFAEGMRTGERSAMTAAAAGMKQYFAVKGGEPTGADAELQLKWGIASLQAGDRDAGIGLLLELMGEQGSDPIGERAAILYAEAMIAGYERREQTADDAEDSAMLLLGDHPSEKAAGLAYRAASSFLGAREYERAARLAGEIESSKAAPKPLIYDARLVQAEAHLFMNDLGSTRRKAISVLGDARMDPDSRIRDRARDLYLLASLREVEAKTAAGDWNSAAALLEELGGRFPEAPEAPLYYLRAMRSYRVGEDKEGMLRVGQLLLQKFPRRGEAVEVAGAIGPYLEERKEYLKAADLYADIAERFPKSDQAPRFLFHSASLSNEHGNPEVAGKRFSSYRTKYPESRWRTAYATLSVGLLAWKGGETGTAIREMEEGLRRVEAGLEADAPGELRELAGKAQIAIGEYWADQFRKLKLVAPMEKNLALKTRLFRKSLAAFEKAEREAPLEAAVHASQRSGDLLVEFGKAVLDSQRPKGMKGEERAMYEEALAARARTYFDRAVDWYAGALDRIEEEGGPSDLVFPVLQRMEEAQELLEEKPGGSDRK